MESLVTLILELKWPLVIVVLAFLFRRQLQALFERVTNLSISAGSFKLETALRGHVPPEVIRKVKQLPGSSRLQGGHRELTILQLQTRGYTSLHEVLAPDQVSQVLRTYLSEMTDVVFGLNGTIDRYEETTLTAYWGAPLEVDDAPQRACDAAIAMQQRIQAISPELEAMGIPPLLPLIAITTADVMVGDFGSRQRPNYSLIGDYKDILHGLVRLNDNFRTNILLTEYTYKHVQNDFEVRLLKDRLITRGKQVPIAVYELLGRRPG